MANSMNPAAAAAADAKEEAGSEQVSPLIAQSTAWWQGVQDQFKQALGTALEKSSANFEAARSATESMTKAATAKPAAARSKTAAKPKTATKAKSTPTRSRKAG